MDSLFDQSVYSLQFNLLKIWGAWPIETPKRWKRKLFLCYSVVMLLITSFFIYVGFLDLLDTFAANDFRRICWNLCVNVIIVGTLDKNIRAYRYADDINKLRVKLHRDPESCANPKELEIYENNKKSFRKLLKLFHYTLAFFLPIWIFDALYRYYKTGQMPLPSRWPVQIGEDDWFLWIFVPGFQVVYAGGYLLHAMTTDLAMFGLLFQMCREYDFLLQQINDLNEYWQGRENDRGEISGNSECNQYLRKKHMKLKLGSIIVRQKEIIQLTYDYERNFNISMLVQIFLGGFLIVLNCIQTLTLSLEFDLKMTPQGAYVATITLDLFFVCLLGNKVSDRCRQMGDALYNMPWYTMDVDLRKDILLILVRCQKPPRITSGRLIDLNMESFSETMKNLYRWMAVFRQIGFS